MLSSAEKLANVQISVVAFYSFQSFAMAGDCRQQSASAVPLIAPAVVNALMRLTGKRYGSLPLVTV